MMSRNDIDKRKENANTAINDEYSNRREKFKEVISVSKET